MFCQNCGNQISENIAFCPKCGTKVIGKESVMQDKAAQPKTPDQAQPPKKKTGFIILAAALVAVVGMIAGAAAFFYKGKDQTPEELAETSTQQTEEISEPVQESKPQLDMEAKMHLKHLMESMVLAAWWNSDDDAGGHRVETVNHMQTWADELYQGNWENMGDWLGTTALVYYSYPKNDYNSGREDMPYIEKIMTRPEAEEILNDPNWGNGRAWLLTREQLEYLAYAASGTDWNLQKVEDIAGAHPVSGSESATKQIGDKIIFTTIADSVSLDWVYLENMISEYTKEGNWKVSADCIYGTIGPPIELKIADITFTVVENPKSCFNGCSITGMNLTPTDNSAWTKAYYDYLTENKMKGDSEFCEDFEPDDRISITFCNIDGDKIPEMYLKMDGLMLGMLYTYHNGQVEMLMDNPGYRSDIQWIEEENRVLDSYGTMGTSYTEAIWIEEIVDGKLHTIAEGEVEWDMGLSDEIIRAKWNGEEVTGEQYDAYLNAAFDGRKSNTAMAIFDNLSDALAYLQKIE
ncbi:MAG: zinc-ribbon domain-containing protein [Blautia sp.]|nr:zinc-ribbon domain-containing protein [Lachnoclostridium sp.]MCM1212755.1 zinc-ribbon domain-containing protein [Blautia sp.]